MSSSQNEFVLQVKHLSKAFPGVQALADVSLEIRPGTVRALMGENGAGKSTLMKILAGLCQPDAGEIWYAGKQVRIAGPATALRLGISMVHQELMPFPELSVAENIFIGREPCRRLPGWIDRPQMQRRAAELLSSLGCTIHPGSKMKQLSVAEIQTVEIARALLQRTKILILDEPTSAVSESEVDRLFAIVNRLKQQGVAVIYISHKMEETFRIADEVTVLRDGRHVATVPRNELTPERLISLMVGRELKPALERTPMAGMPVALSLRGFGRKGKFQDINLDLRCGEIVGIAGLLGAGRTDLVNALFGMPPADQGGMHLHGKRVSIRSPREAIAKGLALVSEDRKRFGLVLKLSVKENITLGNLAQCATGPLIRKRRELGMAEAQVRQFGIRTAGLDRPVKLLSGGNQQKVVISRALLGDPSVIVLDEPTRGIDVRAKAELYDLITGLAGKGKAILLVSSELPELFRLCNRMLVMRQGRLVAEFNAQQTSQQEILACAMPA